MVLIALALIAEHRSAARLDLAGVNRAFFLVNAIVGGVFLAAVGADLFAFPSAMR
jgi:hypothetical protein